MVTQRMDSIPLYSWTDKPNFGDALSKVVVEWVAKRPVRAAHSEEQGKLLAIGSVLHQARDNDVVWCTGIHPRHHQ
ncbi:MAG: hypothetical protein AABY13_02950, partial [Nanoarchaeota archaeon]